MYLGLSKRITVPIVASFGGSLPIMRGICRITQNSPFTEKCQVGCFANRDERADLLEKCSAYLLSTDVNRYTYRVTRIDRVAQIKLEIK